MLLQAIRVCGFGILVLALSLACESGPGHSPEEITRNDVDADGDGYCAGGYEHHELCSAAGMHPGLIDCNDTDAATHPGATESCGDTVDNDCDGHVNEDCACTTLTLYRDRDTDGFGDPGSPREVCEEDAPLDGYVEDNTDCDDNDETVYPGAGCDISVSNATELSSALATADPGEIILLAEGDYIGRFEVTVSGTPGKYITIKGPDTGVAKIVGSGGGYRGALEIHHQEYIIVENLEITNPSGELGIYLTGQNGENQGDGCAHIILRRLYVHDVGDEGIKVRNLNTHDILIENNRVHSTGGSAIDVQGAYPDRFPEPASRPRRIIIRNNLIWDAGFAGIGNEIADQLHIYDNIVLGCRLGLDIGCGNDIIIRNNLVTSYAHYDDILVDPSRTTIDLTDHPRHTESPGVQHSRDCSDGIAVSGTHMTLIYDNEITDCNGNGDLIISYDHLDGGQRHNTDGGHRYNLFFRNRVHHNRAYQTIEEFDKQAGAEAFDQIYINNVFADNHASQGIQFSHSVRLIFANNTIINGDAVAVKEDSDNAIVKNNLFYNSSGISFSGDSTPHTDSNNVVTADPDIFVDLPNGDYHLDADSAGICIDQGDDMTGDLNAVFSLFDDAYGTADFNWHADFVADFKFDYREDLDGNQQGASWDVGAYAEPQ